MIIFLIKDNILSYRREKLLSGNKSVFLDDLKGLVRSEEAFYINVQGETANKTFTSTHFSQLAR